MSRKSRRRKRGVCVAGIGDCRAQHTGGSLWCGIESQCCAGGSFWRNFGYSDQWRHFSGFLRRLRFCAYAHRRHNTRRSLRRGRRGAGRTAQCRSFEPGSRQKFYTQHPRSLLLTFKRIFRHCNKGVFHGRTGNYGAKSGSRLNSVE